MLRPPGSLHLPAPILGQACPSHCCSGFNPSAHQSSGPLYENFLLNCCWSTDKTVGREILSPRHIETIQFCLVSTDFPLLLPHGQAWGWQWAGGRVSTERVVWNERKYLVPSFYLLFWGLLIHCYSWYLRVPYPQIQPMADQKYFLLKLHCGPGWHA